MAQDRRKAPPRSQKTMSSPKPTESHTGISREMREISRDATRLMVSARSLAADAYLRGACDPDNEQIASDEEAFRALGEALRGWLDHHGRP